MTSRWSRVGPAWVAHARDAAEMRCLGCDLAGVLRAGDLVILDGPLGAGKTTLVAGIGIGLHVRGAVTSPTFVIARVHPGPVVDLVHVDAYRLAGSLEVDDLDLDADIDRSVTLIEWGAGKVEELASERLYVSLERAIGASDFAEGDDGAGGERVLQVRGVGPRWAHLVLPAQ